MVKRIKLILDKLIPEELSLERLIRRHIEIRQQHEGLLQRLDRQ